MAPTTGDPLPARGEVWWSRMDKKRPLIVVQSDSVREPRVQTFLVVPLTSRLHLQGLPGNVRLDRASTGLSRVSIANVYDIQKVLRVVFLERVGRLPQEKLDSISAGLRLVLQL